MLNLIAFFNQNNVTKNNVQKQWVKVMYTLWWRWEKISGKSLDTGDDTQEGTVCYTDDLLL